MIARIKGAKCILLKAENLLESDILDQFANRIGLQQEYHDGFMELSIDISRLIGKYESINNSQAVSIANYFHTLKGSGVPSDLANELTVHYQDALMGVGAKND